MAEQDQRLEQRIKTLEYEFKILKNEIQRTLLDIQEQVLIHYYPTLRADETQPEQDAKASLDTLREKLGGPANSPEGDSSGPVPAIKKVSLDEVRNKREEAGVVPAEEPAKQPSIDQTTALALSTWASNSVTKIGAERTRKLIDASATRGYVTPVVREVLFKLTTLSADDPKSQEKIATNDILNSLLKLNEVLGKGTDVEQALSLIDEAKLG